MFTAKNLQQSVFVIHKYEGQEDLLSYPFANIKLLLNLINRFENQLSHSQTIDSFNSLNGNLGLNEKRRGHLYTFR